MLLRELELDPERQIRICTEHGSNFIYIGAFKDLDLRKLTKETSMRVTARLLDTVFLYHQRRGWTKNNPAVRGAMNRFLEWKPVAEREVLEQYPGKYEYSLVIRITGSEGWLEYDPHLRPLNPGSIGTDSAEELVASIYRGVCTELVHAYEVGAASVIRQCEHEIRSNRYGLLEDPNGLIRQCKKRGGVK